MTFAEQLEKDKDVFFDIDEFAEQVAYDDTISQKTILAVFDFGAGFDTSNPKDTATMLVKKTDVLAPDYRHTIIRDGVTWYIFRDTSQSRVGIEKNGLWEIKITANERYKDFR